MSHCEIGPPRNMYIGKDAVLYFNGQRVIGPVPAENDYTIVSTCNVALVPPRYRLNTGHGFERVDAPCADAETWRQWGFVCHDDNWADEPVDVHSIRRRCFICGDRFVTGRYSSRALCDEHERKRIY